MNLMNRNFTRFLMMGVFSRVCSGVEEKVSRLFELCSLHVEPSNRPKFMYLCSEFYVLGVIRTLQGWSGSQDTELPI